MRNKQAAKNMIANVFLQGIIFLSGIVLPRFFLQEYGSSINGMVTSINQFLVYLGLAEAGVGTASVVALYAPLAKDDKDGVNAILSASRRFYNRSGYLFGSLVIAFMLVYPYLITGQLSSGLVRTMIIVLASSILVDYFLLGKYKVLLTANQEGYVVAYVQAVGTMLNMIVSIVLIYCHVHVLLVKVAATLVYIFRFFFVKAYVVKHYPEADYKVVPKMEGLNQRSAALLHQIVGVIVNNTDIVLLTVCLGAKSLIEVSVYGIYNMVVYAVNLMMDSFSNGLTAGFGEVISKGEKAVLKKSFSNYEYIYMMILFWVFTCMTVLIVPFVMVYTLDVSDADYIRPLSAVLFSVLVLLQNIRIPGLTIICAAGHFRETRKQAILEAVINIGVSLLFIWDYGINGVLLGTICSYGYRSLEVILYNRKHFVNGTGKATFFRIIRNLAISCVCIWIGFQLIPQSMESFIQWVLFAALIAGISGISLIVVNYIFERQEFRSAMQRLKSIRH